MNVEEFREYCLSLKGVEEKMPFVNVADRYSRDVLCFYVGDKWFCFVLSFCFRLLLFALLDHLIHYIVTLFELLFFLILHFSHNSFNNP